MFDFLADIGTYESRRVGRYDDEKLMVSTAGVSDGNYPYETAVRHPDYNNNQMVIVQAYDTKQEAEAGHAEWVERMTKEPLPEFLQDCQNSEVSQFLEASDLRFERTSKTGA